MTFNYRHKRDVHQKKCFNSETDNTPEQEEVSSSSKGNDAAMASREDCNTVTSRDDEVVMTSRDNADRVFKEPPLIIPPRFGDRIEFPLSTSGRQTRVTELGELPQSTSGQFNYPTAVPNLHFQYVDPDQGFSWAVFPH